jgi:hypothetical protein
LLICIEDLGDTYRSPSVVTTLTSGPRWGTAPLKVVVGLEWSNDPKSYARNCIATGRVSLAIHVKGDDPEERDGWTMLKII